jgi:hypothetical protein
MVEGSVGDDGLEFFGELVEYDLLEGTVRANAPALQ